MEEIYIIHNLGFSRFYKICKVHRQKCTSITCLLCNGLVSQWPRPPDGTEAGQKVQWQGFFCRSPYFLCIHSRPHLRWFPWDPDRPRRLQRHRARSSMASGTDSSRRFPADSCRRLIAAGYHKRRDRDKIRNNQWNENWMDGSPGASHSPFSLPFSFQLDTWPAPNRAANTLEIIGLLHLAQNRKFGPSFYI